MDSLTLVTAYQVFVDVVEKTDQALQFYKQFASLTNSLSKGFLIIEDTGYINNIYKDYLIFIEQANRKKHNEIEIAKKIVNDNTNAVIEFTIPKSLSVTSSLVNNSINTSNFQNTTFKGRKKNFIVKFK